MTGVRRVRQDRDAGEIRNRFLQQLQLLVHEKCADRVRQACHIAARFGKACNEPEPDRVTSADHHDGNRTGRPPRLQSSRGGQRDDEIDIQADKIRREIGQAIGMPFCEPILDDNVPAFDPTQLSERAAEWSLRRALSSKPAEPVTKYPIR